MLQILVGLRGAETLTPHVIGLTDNSWLVGLFVLTHMLVGVAAAAIACVFFFDRAAATRAMFDNRIALGIFMACCGCSHVCNALNFYFSLYWLYAVLMVVTCIVSITVSTLTVGSVRTKRAPPA